MVHSKSVLVFVLYTTVMSIAPYNKEFLSERGKNFHVGLDFI